MTGENTVSGTLLHEREIRLGALVAEAALDGILAVDTDRRVIFVNSRFGTLWGLAAGEITCGDDEDLLSKVLNKVADPDAFVERIRHLYDQPGETHRDEIVLNDKRVIGRYSAPLIAEDGQQLGRVWFFRDVSERKAAERATERLNHVRSILYETRSMILHAGNRGELYREACRIAVEKGGLRLAWIGVLDDSGDLQPTAVHGHGHDYVSMLRISGRADAHDAASRALRERTAQVCYDIEADASVPQRQHALRNGLRSLIAQPLLVHQRTLGALLLYSSQAGFFDAEEMRLIEQLADDIAHAIEFIDHREQLEYLAHFDPLTGLANRVMFAQRLHDMMLSARTNDSGLVTILVDIERFRSINGTLGTAAGDYVLREITARLLSVAGTSSCVARIGGDVFAIAAPHTPAEPDCVELRDALRDRLNEPIALGNGLMRPTARLGIALFPGDGDSAETLFRNAEAALKAAKATGQRFLFYNHDLGLGARHKLSLESQLREALDSEQFVLHYQPKIDVRTGAITGVEALIRWQSPEQGLILPGRFVPLLEETGLIVEVGRWVLLRAVADQQHWIGEGLPAPKVAINLSVLQLRQPDFLDMLRSAIACSTGTRPTLDIEVTESMLMADVEVNIRKLIAVREMGISIAVDDFGIGYSSLAYLARLPIDAVKIDRSFVVKMLDSADALDIVSVIISLGRSIGLKVVAEGVASEDQLKLLRLLRCDEVQGFLFGPGLPPEKFAELLRTGRGLPPTVNIQLPRE